MDVSRSHAIIFRKCIKKKDETVCSMCKRKLHTMSKDLVADLSSREEGNGALFWDISEDPDNQGHYKTLLQTLKEKKKFSPDAYIQNEFGRCRFQSCSFTFKSTVEAERH